MKKIVYITGTRADFGLMSSVLREIRGSEDLDLKIIVTGMHLSPEFGYTLAEVKKEGYEFEIIDASYHSDTLSATPLFLASFLDKLTNKLIQLKPDLLLLLGDRAEMLAGAIAGQYLNIPVAHISGGDLTGHVDNSIRHAITKLSHIHFPISKKSADRIIKIGEHKNRVFIVGSTSLDNIKSKNLPEKRSLLKKYGVDDSLPYVILIQHPVITELDKVEEHIKRTLDAIRKLKIQSIVIHPNADAGGKRIIKVIKEYEKLPYINSFSNIPYLDYLGLNKNATVIVGNSSSGIVESTSFKIPAINIGSRQNGRERGENVIDVGYNTQEIIVALQKALHDENFKQKCLYAKSPYGNGTAGKKIARILTRLKINNLLLDKNSAQRILKPKFKRFNDLKAEDINFDFHMHTTQTDGKSTVEEMITQAKKLKLDSIAFTEHANSSTDWFHDFKAHIDELRINEELDIVIGIEAKSLDFQGSIDVNQNIVDNAEVIIGSVHRYPDGKGGLIELDKILELGAKKAAEIEFNLANGLLQNGQIDILGHPFGVYSKFFDTFPERFMEQLFNLSLKRGIAIEINTCYNINQDNFFSLLRKINPYVSIGSNAHKESEIGRSFNTIKMRL